MRTSIRSKKFTMGVILFLVIILLLSVLSVFYLNRLSKKTSAILKENHYSVVFARDMAENLTIINKELTNCILANQNPDTLSISKELKLFSKSLKSEQNNLTEFGEGKLVSAIEIGFDEYRDSVVLFTKSPNDATRVLHLQKKFDGLYQQLMLLSLMNEQAIEKKTDDAKISAKDASIQMSFIGTLCFLIAYGFTFIFASYFNDRFYQLYNGIKDIASSNYNQKLSFDGKDEFNEISLIINEMTQKLAINNQNNAIDSHVGLERENNINEIQEIKRTLIRLKSFEEQALELISKLENKK
jgi:two-component system, NtrC family, sensor histidine kinase KinB